VKERLLYTASCPFEAARIVSILPDGHRARNMHGHSFRARVRAEFPLDWGLFPGGETSILTSALASAVATLDYQLLNDHVTTPTDENLAKWLRTQLDVPGIELLGIQSTGDQGADLDGLGHAHVWRRFRFESAHQLPNVPKGHQCGRMHGHGFEVILHADQDLHGNDMGIDYDKLGEIWSPLQEELNFSCLNDIPGLENPTSEMLASWIWRRIKPMLKELSWITVYETVTAGCHFDGSHYRIWKEFRFESACRLVRAPEGDARRKLHGHSYLCRLHLTSPLDEVLGWTVDYGDVKEIFKPVYKELDHYFLNDLPGMLDGDLATVLRWIKTNLAQHLPQLDRIDLFETPNCGAILSWGEQPPALPT
jgi:6-pyruvoyltetrahydropterin/6-carboxytetrahydropterin synthase